METTQEFPLRWLPLEQLRESPFNPRKRYDPERLLELAASIKEHGVIEPIIVRPLDGDRFEIVAGSRRFRAAKQAHRETLPAIVRPLSDDEAMKVMTIENLQREDVHPLEEADGYRLLMKHGGYDVMALASTIGKSESYIYQRLKLLDLEPKVREAFFADQITAGHAILLARLTPPDQKLALAECLEENFSVRGLMQWIEDEIYRDLSKVPFDVADAALVRKAGACTTCPKRSGTQPSLFADITSRETCLDPDCFKAKHVAFLARREDELKEAKQAVVRIATGYGGLGLDQDKGKVLRSYDYTKAGAKKCPDTKLGLVVAGDNIGADLRVCTNPKCRVHHPAAPRHESTPAEKKAKREGAIDKLVEPRVREAMLRKAMAGPKSIADWRVVASCCLDQLYHDDRAMALCEVRGLKYAKSGWRGGRDAIEKELRRCKSTEALRNWTFQIALTGGGLDDFEDLAKGMGVDVAGIRKQAATEFEAGKAKAQTSAKKKEGK